MTTPSRPPTPTPHDPALDSPRGPRHQREERDVSEQVIGVGDKIRFHPNGGRRWWTVRDRDDRFIVATAQAPFQPKGTLWYTVVDLTGWQDKRYNGAGNGIVRSSLNTLGGGWDLDDEGIAAIIPALLSGEWELSYRRVATVWDIDHKPALATPASSRGRCVCRGGPHGGFTCRACR